MHCPAGLTSLATCLTAASGLALLDVSGCGVGPPGAAALGTALSAGAPLATVCLRGNAVGPSGAEALGAALARTATLEELDAGSNQVRGLGIREGLEIRDPLNRPLPLLDASSREM